MANSNFRLYVDFDGTVTDIDVGNGIFARFIRKELLEKGWHEEIINEWKAERLSSLQCLTMECANSVATEDEMKEELKNYPLTEGFVETAQFCQTNEIPLMILSDGLDYYIDHILKMHGLENIDFKANHLIFGESTLGVEFPHSEYGCGKCGNCKRWHMRTHSKQGECVIYVGDGYSDRYAIKSADVVFARRDLEAYCKRENIDYHPFETFHEVLSYLKSGHEDI